VHAFLLRSHKIKRENPKLKGKMQNILCSVKKNDPRTLPMALRCARSEMIDSNGTNGSPRMALGRYPQLKESCNEGT
jgi:hypothetical protein